MPITPMEVSASLTSSSLNGLMIASIFFIRDPPGRVHSNRRAGELAAKTREIRRFDDARGRGRAPACLGNGHARAKCPRFGRWVERADGAAGPLSPAYGRRCGMPCLRIFE